MVAVAAAVEFLYGVCVVGFGTREVWGEKKRSIGMLAFLFTPCDIGYTCYEMNVFRWKGGVAVDDGNRHGGAVFDWNLYGDPRRLMYRAGVLLEKLSTFRTIYSQKK